MEEWKILDDVELTKKVYTEKGIAWGAFWGGPVAAGYFLIENYKSLGHKAVVTKAWGITIFSTIIYFILAYFIKEVGRISIIPLFIICMMLARQVFTQKQAADVAAHIKRGGKVHSNWRVAGISLLFFLGTIGSIGSVWMMYTIQRPMVTIPLPVELVGPTTPARSTTSSRNNLMKSVVNNLQSKSYGAAGHVIVYNDFFFSELKIDSIAEELTSLGFFELDNKKSIYLEKVLFDYEFSITDASADVANEKTRIQYEQLRANMEAFLKDGKVTILLMDEDSEAVLLRFGV
ncbi:MAG: Unknown protein [uncultured Aureispira sp.]|uniref:Uncharacterized protein n=1 Tax=uncultured Aureispira sp. TaxID=1331704 RepID=A0A6S6UFP2_9BACT|nr:MAG: Unknown protein [uncultured Aureispira sp.]